MIEKFEEGLSGSWAQQQGVFDVQNPLPLYHKFKAGQHQRTERYYHLTAITQNGLKLMDVSIPDPKRASSSNPKSGGCQGVVQGFCSQWARSPCYPLIVFVIFAKLKDWLLVSPSHCRRSRFASCTRHPRTTPQPQPPPTASLWLGPPKHPCYADISRGFLRMKIFKMRISK